MKRMIVSITGQHRDKRLDKQPAFTNTRELKWNMIDEQIES
jgi:hypothetical protein